jgi:hypothetical protein
MVNKRGVHLLAALATLALASGCLTPLMMSNSNIPIAGRAYQVLGPTEAESCIQSILGIPISTDASLHTTLAVARDRLKADALIDLTVDRYTLTTGFYNKSCAIVHALAIRFVDAQAPFLEPEPAVPPVPAPAAAARAPAVEQPPAAALAEPAAKKAEDRIRAPGPAAPAAPAQPRK